jgi:hypothetical protein
VLWVGGGDSGPLNEILKYPNLELAVGLELDQQVTRLAFKHFASRPHYDNPKVQWWYGDASKSLSMLPKDYFGSFDLVIVDLSDTVFSLSVSAELDVIEAISLLLRPGGIFEMNELFLKKVSDVFEYSMLYKFTGVPQICEQVAVFASNDVDFMYQDLTEHGFVANATLLLERDGMKTRHQFDRVHDYRRNPSPAFKKLCKKMVHGESDERPQEEASGITMIVEAENLTVDLSSFEVVRNSIVEAVENVGLTVIPKAAGNPLSSSLVFAMKQGYIVARFWPDFKYCALDIHLWSSFDRHDALKTAIVVRALGGSLENKSTSSYRIVTGGMFGLPGWRDERGTHGPQVSQVCTDEKEVARDGASDEMVVKQAINMSLDAIRGDNLVVAVICGESPDGCQSLEVVTGNPKFTQVIPLYDCHSLVETDDVEACTMHKVRKTVADAGRIDAIILDANSSRMSGSIISFLHEQNHIDRKNIFVVGTTDSKDELWRRRLIADIYAEISFEPLFRALVLFNTTASSLELSVVASGDEFFMEHLTTAVSHSQEKSADVAIEIRNIFGGLWRGYKKDLASPSDFLNTAVAGDYNNEDALDQWTSQTPLGVQTLLQFTNSVDGIPTLLDMEEVLLACRSALSTRTTSMMFVQEEFGGDGAVCAGAWRTGTAVIIWDGRFQLDLNIFSSGGIDEIESFEQDVKSKLPGLGGWLRDLQPRGYGRVVNFDKDLQGTTNFFKTNM